MQAAENRVIGQAQRSRAAAAAMQSATHGVVGSGSVGGKPTSVSSTSTHVHICKGKYYHRRGPGSHCSDIRSEVGGLQRGCRHPGRGSESNQTDQLVPSGVAAVAHQPPFAMLGRQGMRRRPNWDAPAKLPSDKLVMRRDAEGVIGAEVRNDPNLATHPGGVAASVAAAAMLNQSK
ncbi:seed maturation protein [Actinidia rufa]|uniref:Seed maturation protein n=1 Tax=Actinidia rufa TaxID=165716 RepID=A0A7J0FVY9_9ERIC|nr:seed maturation protein [Actinidia rufa]